MTHIWLEAPPSLVEQVAELTATVETLRREKEDRRHEFNDLIEGYETLSHKYDGLLAAVGQLEQEMREWCSPDGCVPDGDDELTLVTRWADALASLGAQRETP